jgi:lon-related putative ATP-dependent protease
MVNVAVDHGETEHAPVVYLDHPTYQKLAGWVEYQAFQGALVTDFNMIRPGALHRANGGYLLVDVMRILTQPFAWEGLKRALQSRELNIESARQMMGLVSTVTLDPEAVPLQVKVVLLGSRLLYYLLSAYDPDFPELFKIEADFDDRMDRDEGNEALYAKLIAGAVKRDELKPFHRDAVARVIERSARMAGDREKLSVKTRGILDLLREADHWAGEDGGDQVKAEHVQKAIDHRIYRASRMRDRVQDEIERGTIFIDTEGEEAGQVNGLSVLQLGGFAFGRPSRITARVKLGKGEVVNIEREVELSGPIHSKGVLILAGFLGGRYAQDHPLSLSASLVFEQSYGGVDGDSASSAELYALLSTLAETPLKQSLAVTGSVNQKGEIQPVGGVNEKIEGFFDVCRRRDFTGDQGVLIPAANVKHLMLRHDVVKAVKEGTFHVWPVETVDQGMEILTGRIMGERQEDGTFPEGTVNAAVENRLVDLAEKWKRFAGSREED